MARFLKIWAQKRARHRFCHILLIKPTFGGDTDPTPREEEDQRILRSYSSGPMLNASHITSFHPPSNPAIVVPELPPGSQIACPGSPGWNVHPSVSVSRCGPWTAGCPVPAGTRAVRIQAHICLIRKHWRLSK